MGDKRYICEDCGVKWFVTPAHPEVEAPFECGACGGSLTPLPGADPPASYGAGRIR